MAFDLIDELEAIVDAFEREHVEYAVCGGLALGLHGLPRDIPARKTFGLATGRPREVQRQSKIAPGNGNLLSLDLLVVAPDLEPVWETRIPLASRDRKMTVVSRQGLVTMKKIAGRPQDLVDIARLEGTSNPDDDAL